MTHFALIAAASFCALPTFASDMTFEQVKVDAGKTLYKA